MSDENTIKLAISTCPNDTFAFHAILQNKIDLCGIEFDIQLLDIQQLNKGLFDGQFDIAKASFHAAMYLSEKYLVLPVGSALGFGVGPLLLSAAKGTTPSGNSELTTLCPGEHTTATLLFRLFFGMDPRVRHDVFSNIMPRLKAGDVDFGVCIHEGRFTWESEGLNLVEDLGAMWESRTGMPLPLGGILARKTLSSQTIATVSRIIRQSIEYGLLHRDETLVTMRKYAQEFADEVLFSHVDLYVNDWTLELGTVGRNALRSLADKAREVGMGVPGDQLLSVWSESVDRCKR